MSLLPLAIEAQDSTITFPFALKTHPLSMESEIGVQSCQDTFTLFNTKNFYDLGVILPAWKPIIHEDYVAVVEGIVQSDLSDGSMGPHITHEDLPFYHYTHDFNFNIIPDKTNDNRYFYHLPKLLYEHEGGVMDTALRSTVHVEWESGVGSVNKNNPVSDLNNMGKSAGFFSKGHEPGDPFWNWPTIDDWVHVEGHYVWDRGHPPAKAEIHPARMVAVKRNLPHLISHEQKKIAATRIDVFASGDGGALKNNRTDAPGFVKRTKMSSKDYEVLISHSIRKVNPNSKLKWTVLKRSGDSFIYDEEIIQINDSTVKIFIPWKQKGAGDHEVYARSIFLFWDETEKQTELEFYKVRLDELYFKKLSEMTGKAQLRVFVNVGSDWYFINDWFADKKGRILSKGFGNTSKKNWKLNKEIEVCLPKGKEFRVYLAGWEVDGIDVMMGDLFDQNSPCSREVKNFFKYRFFSFPMLFRGCIDDNLGEISNRFSSKNLMRFNKINDTVLRGINEDPCPFSEWQLAERIFLNYSIEKISP